MSGGGDGDGEGGSGGDVGGDDGDVGGDGNVNKLSRSLVHHQLGRLCLCVGLGGDEQMRKQE